MAEFKRAATRTNSNPATLTTITDGTSPVFSEGKSFWRRADNASNKLSEDQRDSRILAESPSLQKVCKEYITYCNQEGFPRLDRVRLVSSVWRAPH